MAQFIGKQISAVFAGATATNVLGWTFNASCEMTDSSRADAGASHDGKTYMAGYPNCTATLNTHNDAGAGAAYLCHKGQSGTLVLNRVAGTAASGYYTGSAICTNVETASEMRGIVATTYSFQFTGTVSFAVA